MVAPPIRRPQPQSPDELLRQLDALQSMFGLANPGMPGMMTPGSRGPQMAQNPGPVMPQTMQTNPGMPGMMTPGTVTQFPLGQGASPYGTRTNVGMPTSIPSREGIQPAGPAAAPGGAAPPGLPTMSPETQQSDMSGLLSSLGKGMGGGAGGGNAPAGSISMRNAPGVEASPADFPAAIQSWVALLNQLGLGR